MNVVACFDLIALLKPYYERVTIQELPQQGTYKVSQSNETNEGGVRREHNSNTGCEEASL